MQLRFATLRVVPLLSIVAILVVSGVAEAQPTLSKTFAPGILGPGSNSRAFFLIDNSGSGTAVGSLSFTDVLPAGVTISDPAIPTSTCGGSLSAPNGGGTISLTGGSVAANSSCQVGVYVTSSTVGIHTNPAVTLNSTAGSSMSLPRDLPVDSSRPGFTKSFSPSAIVPGGVSTLTFLIDNSLNAAIVTNLGMGDELPMGMAVAATPNASTTCTGGTITASAGSSAIVYASGGSVGAGASCTVSVDVTTSVASDLDNQITDLISSAGGSARALATLSALAPTFTKSFDGPTVAGGTPMLTFTITNPDPSNAITNITFTDDLDATLSGLTAVGLPTLNDCGAGSTVSGTSLVTLSGGSLAASGNCSFSVTLQVPAAAPSGTYPNTTSSLSGNGVSIAGPATDDLIVEPPPSFGKAFSPSSVGIAEASTLTFTIDNTAASVAATSLDFTDNLPASIVVAPTPNASSTCGGTLTATAGAVVITLAGGSVGAGATCTCQADVVASAAGAYDNTTGDLTSSSGNSGTASDSLTVEPPPTFSKSFSPSSLALGSPATLTFTFDNTASGVDATGLDFTDNLPAGMLVATLPNASTTCTGGTITATADTGVIGYTGGSVGAGASCTVQADVVVTAIGDYVNTTGDATSSSGNSGPANASLHVGLANIPTLSSWMLIALAVLLAGVALKKLQG